MSSVQQFRLRWNNHQPNFITVFTKLLNSEELVDVTLGAEGQNLQAHKVVLSACSSYFQTLFKMNPCKHPIVILKDVKYEDLKVIVDFMYYGEVNVSQEQLPAILKTAEVLKVKGLAEMPEQNNISLSKSRSLSSDKGDEASVVNAECSSAWGSDSARQSPSPLPTSPSVRRKRLRKTSTGSGSGSTERTSERTSEELSLDVNMVKTEPTSFQSEGESVRSNSSLRNSLQEASTESEPPDGLHDSNDEPPNMHSSQESTTGPIIESNPGPSTVYNPGQGKLGTKRGRFLMRQPRIKKESELHLITHPSPESDGLRSISPQGSPQYTASSIRPESRPPVEMEVLTSSPSPRASTTPTREIPKISTVTVSVSSSQQLTVPGLRIDRQSIDSKPTRVPSPTLTQNTQQISNSSMALLSVPTTGYLVKQHSHPNLPSHTSSSLTGHPVLVQRQHSQPTGRVTQPTHPQLVRILVPNQDPQPVGKVTDPFNMELLPSSSMSYEEPCPPTVLVEAITGAPLLRLVSEPHSNSSVGSPSGATSQSVVPACSASGTTSGSHLRVRSDELRRATSSPQPTSPHVMEVSGTPEPARSGHCPVQRDGPALGCNYCWNTIDAHGRTLRRKTKYHCPECKTNLCIVPCFQEYHERQNNKDSPNNSSSSVMRLLPKTSSI